MLSTVQGTLCTVDASLEDPVQIPLRNRDGEVIAYALVDAEDYEATTTRRWCLCNGYVARSGGVRKANIKLHRQVMGLPPGDPRMVDHINHDRLDNRKANLRIVTNAQNQQNRRGAMRNSRSGIRGVCWAAREQRWRATATVDGRTRHLGYFPTSDEAASAVAAFRREHMPYATN